MPRSAKIYGSLSQATRQTLHSSTPSENREALKVKEVCQKRALSPSLKPSLKKRRVELLSAEHSKMLKELYLFKIYALLRSLEEGQGKAEEVNEEIDATREKIHKLEVARIPPLFF